MARASISPDRAGLALAAHDAASWPSRRRRARRSSATSSGRTSHAARPSSARCCPRTSRTETPPDRLQHHRPGPAPPLCPARHSQLVGDEECGDLRRRAAGGAHRRVHPGGAGPAAPTVRQEGQAMNWIALKMLTGDRAKYLGIVFGVTFATLLMAQQVSIFCGIMTRHRQPDPATSASADIWVMDPKVRYVDDIKPLPDERPVPRPRRRRAWPGRCGCTRAWLAAPAGGRQLPQVILLGLDDATLVGAPREMVARQPRRPAPARRRHHGRGRLRVPVARASRSQLGQRLRDERPPGRAGRHLQGVAAVPDVADRLHALQPGDAVRAARAQPDVVRAGQAARPASPPRRSCRRHRASRPG